MRVSQQDNLTRSTTKRDIIIMERDEALAELAALKQKIDEKQEKLTLLEQENSNSKDLSEELQDMRHHARV